MSEDSFCPADTLSKMLWSIGARPYSDSHEYLSEALPVWFSNWCEELGTQDCSDEEELFYVYLSEVAVSKRIWEMGIDEQALGASPAEWFDNIRSAVGAEPWNLQDADLNNFLPVRFQNWCGTLGLEDCGDNEDLLFAHICSWIVEERMSDVTEE